ncbi:protein kinase [Penicillium taxi]|uniref:protein kinase n=1 Tax=Penicillium taxi TaxID=168475 RepID=UPI002545AB60|nr:protein kinase [Penicillium taxi]KAJ5888694.1 protein kinase [Penicillium taxi]
MQDMEFPKLDVSPLGDDIIDKCWRNKYPTTAELAAYIEALVPKKKKQGYGMDQDRTADEFYSEQVICQN